LDKEGRYTSEVRSKIPITQNLGFLKKSEFSVWDDFFEGVFACLDFFISEIFDAKIKSFCYCPVDGAHRNAIHATRRIHTFAPINRAGRNVSGIRSIINQQENENYRRNRG
jgi:hypothetical protein